MDDLTKRLAETLRAALPQIRHVRQALEKGGCVVAARDHTVTEERITEVLADYDHRTAKKVFVPRLGMVPEDSRGG